MNEFMINSVVIRNRAKKFGSTFCNKYNLLLNTSVK